MLQFWIAPAAWRVNENEQAALAIRRRLSDGLKRSYWGCPASVDSFGFEIQAALGNILLS